MAGVVFAAARRPGPTPVQDVSNFLGVAVDWAVFLLLAFLVVSFIRRWRRKYREALSLRARLEADANAYAALRAEVASRAEATGGSVVLNVGANGRGSSGPIGSGVDCCCLCGAVLPRAVGRDSAREVVDVDWELPALASTDDGVQPGDVAGAGRRDGWHPVGRELCVECLETLR